MNLLKKSKITSFFIVFNVLCFLVIYLLFGNNWSSKTMIDCGLYNSYLVVELNQYWRLFTCNFIHFDLFHLVSNMYAFYVIGCYIELVIGTKAYLLFILLGSITSNTIMVANYILTGGGLYTFVGGFSGVVFGLLGISFGLSIIKKGIFKEIFNSFIPSLIIMGLAQFLVPNISWQGHISGFVSGLIFIVVFDKFKNRYKKENIIDEKMC